jgi:5-methylcytosine-specific restriction protein A
MKKLTIGNTYSNDELCAFFKCAPQGGMRRSHATNSLLLISNQTQPNDRNPYQDGWKDNILYYTGMGLKGDQDINFAQNRTLAESDSNGVEVHLFEVYIAKQYTYQGKVKLVGRPFQSSQTDLDGTIRNVWVFPIAPKS